MKFIFETFQTYNNKDNILEILRYPFIAITVMSSRPVILYQIILRENSTVYLLTCESFKMCILKARTF